MNALRFLWVIFWFSLAGYFFAIAFDVNLEVIKKDPFAFVKELSKSSREKATDMLSQKITPIDQSKLCPVFKLNSKFTDLQRDNILKDLKGKIIEWKLPVYEVSSESDNVFKIQTFNPSFFGCEYVSTIISLVALNDNDLLKIQTLKTNDVITVRGKITDVSLRHIIIEPAVFSETARLIKLNNDRKSIETNLPYKTTTPPEDNEFEVYIGKSSKEVAGILKKNNINEINFGMMVLKKNQFLMLVQYTPTGLGSIGQIEIYPNASIPKELSDAIGIDGFDLLAKKYNWTALEDVRIFERTYKRDDVMVVEYIAMEFQNIEPNKVISIKTLQKKYK